MRIKSETFLTFVFIVAVCIGAVFYLANNPEPAVSESAVSKPVEVAPPAWVAKYDVEVQNMGRRRKLRPRVRSIGPCVVVEVKTGKRYEIPTFTSHQDVAPLELSEGLMLYQHALSCEIIDKDGISCSYEQTHNGFYTTPPVCHQVK